MNTLSLEKQTKIIQLLVEGNSLRSCSRIANVSFNTVLKFFVSVGKACLKFHSETAVQIRCRRVQCDEIWSFVYTKERNNVNKEFAIGDIWTWVAIDPDSKFVISWFVGDRTLQSAKFFMNDLWCRLRTRVQLSTDGLACYREAVADTFGGKVDFGQLIKQYSSDSIRRDGKKDKRNRYIGAIREAVCGNPDKRYISTSHVERQNLTMRMHIRRFGRETNAFSKKYDNHCYSVALHFVYYNFVKLHGSLRITPAMAIGLSKKFMTIQDIARLVPAPVAKKRGSYKKRL